MKNYALSALEKFANECGIPSKGGVKSGWGKMALANTPMLKFESKHFDAVRKAVKSTLENDKSLMVFFRGISLLDSIKGLPPKGKYFTLCVEASNKERLSQLTIANIKSIGI